MSDEPANSAPLPLPVSVDEFGRSYVEALMALDVCAAERAVCEAMHAQISVADIDELIIAPALWAVSDLCRRGNVSFAGGQLAGAISTRVVALLREVQRVAQTRGTHTVMLATPDGDPEAVALRIAGSLLRGAGYDTVMLGADVAPDALAVSARRFRPAVIAMTATTSVRLDRLLRSIDVVRRSCPGVGFVLGGSGLAEHLLARPNIQACQRVSELVEAVDAIIMRATLN